MKRVVELEGAELALWVAYAVGLESPRIAFDICRVGKLLTPETRDFSPHENWSDGGPLLPGGVVMYRRVNDLHDFTFREGARAGHGEGETLLIAAMRAIVASVYGDTVKTEGD